MTSYVMERDGRTHAQATSYLAAKDRKQTSLRGLEAKGVDVDGAWFDGTQLVVGVDSTADADAVRAAGLRPSTSVTQSSLDKVAQAVMRRAGAGQHVVTVGPNLQKGTVEVRIAEDAPTSLRQRLAAMDRVSVTTADELTTQADVYPGRIMDLSPGTNCSLGYPGRTSSGNNVLLTAGHCVEGSPTSSTPTAPTSARGRTRASAPGTAASTWA